MKNWRALCIGAVVTLVAFAAIVLLFVLIPAGWLDRATATAAVVGGLGGLISGIGAAVAAWFSWRSAQESKDAAVEIQRIGDTSRHALGMATKPSIDVQLGLSVSDPILVLRVVNGFPAREVAAEIDIPGCETYRTGLVPQISDAQQFAAKFRGLPSLTDGVMRHAVVKGDSDLLHLTSRVVVRFGDAQNALRHEQTFEARTIVWPGTERRTATNGTTLIYDRVLDE